MEVRGIVTTPEAIKRVLCNPENVDEVTIVCYAQETLKQLESVKDFGALRPKCFRAVRVWSQLILSSSDFQKNLAVQNVCFQIFHKIAEYPSPRTALLDYRNAVIPLTSLQFDILHSHVPELDNSSKVVMLKKGQVSGSQLNALLQQKELDPENELIYQFEMMHLAYALGIGVFEMDLAQKLINFMSKSEPFEDIVYIYNRTLKSHYRLKNELLQACLSCVARGPCLNTQTTVIHDNNESITITLSSGKTLVILQQEKPDSLHSLLLARYHLTSGNSDAALDALDRIPESLRGVGYYYMRYEIAIQPGLDENPMELLAKGISLDKRCYKLRKLRIEYALTDDDNCLRTLPEVLEDLGIVLNAKPELDYLRAHFVDILVELGNYEEAHEHASILVSRQPNNVQYYILSKKINAQLRHPEDVLPAHKRAK